MANEDITRFDGFQSKFAGASIDVLSAVIGKCVNNIIENHITVECVARGGESLAKSLNLEGDPIDSISGGIFRSIINSMEDASVQHELLAALHELRNIAGRASISA